MYFLTASIILQSTFVEREIYINNFFISKALLNLHQQVLI